MIDFDQTLAFVFQEQIAVLNEMFHTNYTVDDFQTWDTAKILPPEELAFLWGEQGWLDGETTSRASTRGGSMTSLLALRNAGDEVYIVSDRPLSLRVVTQRWITNQLGRFPLILTRSPLSKGDDDERVPTKTLVAASFGITRVVEDAPHHADSLASLAGMGAVYLFDTPANRELKDDEVIERVTVWDTILAREGLS
jgi:hypothetical protein